MSLAVKLLVHSYISRWVGQQVLRQKVWPGPSYSIFCNIMFYSMFLFLLWCPTLVCSECFKPWPIFYTSKLKLMRRRWHIVLCKAQYKPQLSKHYSKQCSTNNVTVHSDEGCMYCIRYNEPHIAKTMGSQKNYIFCPSPMDGSITTFHKGTVAHDLRDLFLVLYEPLQILIFAGSPSNLSCNYNFWHF